MSDGPPVKRARSEVNLGEHTSAEEVVIKEEVEIEDIVKQEVEKENTEVSKHLRQILEAKVGEYHRSVSAWKENKKEEERQSAYLRDLLIKENIKEREDLEDTVKELKESCAGKGEELEKEKVEFNLSLKSLIGEVEILQKEAKISETLKAENVGLNAENVQLKIAAKTAAEMFQQMTEEIEGLKKESAEKDSLINVLKNEVLEKEYVSKDNLQTLEKRHC